MLKSPFREKQLKRAEKTVVKLVSETPRAIEFETILIDKKGRHNHRVTYKRRTKNLKTAFWCTCQYCSFWGVKTKKWCYNKIAVALWMIKNKYLKSYVKKWIYGNVKKTK